jgi:hypothetical protein
MANAELAVPAKSVNAFIIASPVWPKQPLSPLVTCLVAGPLSAQSQQVSTTFVNADGKPIGTAMLKQTPSGVLIDINVKSQVWRSRVGEDTQGCLSLSFQEQVFQFERGSGCEPNRLHQGGGRNGHEQRPWSLSLPCTC